LCAAAVLVVVVMVVVAARTMLVRVGVARDLLLTFAMSSFCAWATSSSRARCSAPDSREQQHAVANSIKVGIAAMFAHGELLLRLVSILPNVTSPYFSDAFSNTGARRGTGHTLCPEIEEDDAALLDGLLEVVAVISQLPWATMARPMVDCKRE